MDDRALVAAMVSGDPRGLEGAYRAYAAPLFAYCRRLLSDADTAADAVHDTFVLAGQRAGQLREPERLRAWLYAIARNECLRHLRGRARQVPLETAGDVPASPAGEPGSAVRDDHLHELVWSAAEGLSESDRHVFELMVRHGLSAVEVGAVLGVSPDHAHARLSRARAQLERSLGVLLVARTGAADCAELAGLLKGWSGVLNALLRKRIGRHIDGCATCGSRRREQLNPAALLSAYAALPFLALPAGLWVRVTGTHSSGGVASSLRLDRATGFPQDPPGRKLPVAIAGAVVLLVLGGAVVTPIMSGRDEPDLVAPAAATTGTATTGPAPAATSGGPPGSTTAASTAAPPPTVDPPGVTTTAVPPTLPPGPTRSFTATLTAAGVPVAAGPCPRFHFVFTAKLSGGVMQRATLLWHYGPPTQEVTPVTTTMAIKGTTASVTLPNVAAPRLTWWVVVVTTDHRTLATNPTLAATPRC